MLQKGQPVTKYFQQRLQQTKSNSRNNLTTKHLRLKVLTNGKIAKIEEDRVSYLTKRKANKCLFLLNTCMFIQIKHKKHIGKVFTD